MNGEDIIRMAREAGCIPRRHPEYDNDIQVFATPDVLVKFAKLVIANNPPQSFMSWQEGYAAGTAAEREACAREIETPYYGEGGQECAAAIRARGQA